MYQRFFKRLIDVVLSLCGTVVLIPVWIVLSIAIVVDDPGPVIFRQKRIARDRNGQRRYFRIYKFRSMKMSAPKDRPTHMLDHPEQYITRVGAFLRRTSLDELPQLLNILVGHMSIIGPRPALWNQTELYAERARYGANAIRPGLTGWAQINGRDALDDVEKARLDGEYAENISFRFDAKCFLATITSVLRHEGVMEGGAGALEKREKDE